jgi:hypothetical protein
MTDASLSRSLCASTLAPSTPTVLPLDDPDASWRGEGCVPQRDLSVMMRRRCGTTERVHCLDSAFTYT